MQTTLVDRILSIEGGRTIKAVKGLSFRENFLRDHFPGYPLMPGVLQLEAMFEAAGWLLRASEGFPAADFLPTSVTAARYARHVRPGEVLVMTVTLTGSEGETYSFKGVGEVDGVRSVIAHFSLGRYTATWEGALDEAGRRALAARLRQQFASLRHGPLPWYRVPQGGPEVSPPGEARDGGVA